MSGVEKTNVDLRLEAVFALDAAPARDPGFTAEVLTRIERRRLALDMALNAAGAVIAASLLWAAWPLLSKWIDELGLQMAPAVMPLGVALAVLISLAIAMRTLEGAPDRP